MGFVSLSGLCIDGPFVSTVRIYKFEVFYIINQINLG